MAFEETNAFPIRAGSFIITQWAVLSSIAHMFLWYAIVTQTFVMLGTNMTSTVGKMLNIPALLQGGNLLFGVSQVDEHYYTFNLL